MRLLFVLLPLCAALNTGIELGFSSAGINYLIGALLPAIEQEFENTTIPGISGKVRATWCSNRRTILQYVWFTMY